MTIQANQSGRLELVGIVSDDVAVEFIHPLRLKITKNRPSRMLPLRYLTAGN